MAAITRKYDNGNYNSQTQHRDFEQKLNPWTQAWTQTWTQVQAQAQTQLGLRLRFSLGLGSDLALAQLRSIQDGWLVFFEFSNVCFNIDV